MMSAYCSGSGRSRWNFSRNTLFTSGEIFGFNSPHGYGLPGVSVMMKNEITLMRKSSSTEMSRRRMMNTAMCQSCASFAYCGR